MTNVRMTGPLVSSCRGCPHNQHNSGPTRTCTQVKNSILPPNYNEQFPAWCPLPAYPQHELARLEAGVQSLQEFVRNERGQNFWVTLCHLLSNYLGVKFDPLVWPLHVTLVADQKVVLVWEHITAMTVQPLSITFIWQAPNEEESKTYKLEIPVSKTLYGHGGGPVQTPTLSVRRIVSAPDKDYETWDPVHGFPAKAKELPPTPLDTNSG